MKITKRQLRSIIQESLPYKGGQPWMDTGAPVKRGPEIYDDLDVELSDKEIEDAMGWEPAEEYDEDGDHDEYNRGYQDGLDGVPADSSYSTDYDTGYEDGQGDATLPDTLMNEQSQLTFNSKGAEQAQELSETVGTALNLFNKYSFNFHGVTDETINRIEEMFMDLVEELGTISVELEERGMG